MRQRIADVLRAFISSLSAAALLMLLLALMLSLYDEIRTVDLAILRLVALLMAVAVVNEILAVKGLPLLLYAAVNTALAGAGVYAVLKSTVFMPDSEGYAFFLGFLIAVSCAYGAFCAWQLPDSNRFVLLADLLLIGIALLMASTFFLNKPVNEPVLAFAAAALLLSVMAASRLRAGGESDHVVRGSGVGGFVVLAAVVLVCVLLCAALLALGSGQVGSIVAVWAFVWNGLGRIFEKLVLLLGALLSLNLGKHVVLERETGHYTVMVIPIGDEEAMGTAPVWVVYVFLALLALAFAALILALLLDFRGKRVSREQKRKRRRIVTRKSHLLPAVLALLAGIRDAVSFETAYRFGERTPQTLYVYAARRFRGKKMAKRKSESPGAYMRRLHAALMAQGAVSQLDQLAQMLDEAIYGGKHIVLSRERNQALREQIRMFPHAGSGKGVHPNAGESNHQ